MTLEYPCHEHNKRYSWLLKHGNISTQEDFEYIDDIIRIKILLDDVTYQRYLKTFEPKQFQ